MGRKLKLSEVVHSKEEDCSKSDFEAQILSISHYLH